MATVGLMNTKRDPCAPVKLSPGDLREHKGYPKLAALVLEGGNLGGSTRVRVLTQWLVRAKMELYCL